MHQICYAKPDEPTSPQPEGKCKVVTLTPEQRARKRVRDKESQRRNRARTKEHIDRLEHELVQFRSQKWRDRTIQERLRRKEAIEKELVKLKKGISILETMLPSDEPSSSHPQITQPDGFSTSTWDEENLLASCYFHEYHVPMVCNCITNYTGPNSLSSKGCEGSEHPPLCPNIPITSRPLSVGYNMSYNQPRFYTLMPPSSIGDSNSIGGIRSEHMFRNKLNIASEDDANSQQFLSDERYRSGIGYTRCPGDGAGMGGS